MNRPNLRLSSFLLSVGGLLLASPVSGQTTPTFLLELEGGPVWQSRNEVQIPNDERGTRFSLDEVVGQGPWPAARFYVTWNINRRHGLRVLLAPLSVTETGSLPGPTGFAGETFQPDEPVDATYKFNSWRLNYRYRFVDRRSLSIWVGFTAKIRDAKVELRQSGNSARDTDLGFVPLLYLAAQRELDPSWHLLFDFNGLAGGPGRAFDAALKLGYEVNDRWALRLGYRTLEGGADVESVYNFAWLHYALISAAYRF